MRGKHLGLVSLGLVAIAASAYSAGCTARIDGCNLNPDCGAGGQGQGGAPPDILECVPEKYHKQNGSPVKDECGIFVSLSGDDANNPGTKSKPLRTIGNAIELAEAMKKPIYLCAEVFPEAIEVPKGITIYGGLDCGASWIYVGDTKKTTIAPDPDLVPIKIPNDGDGSVVHIEDIIAQAADATIAGGSSIAAIADAVLVELVRSELIAGNGQFGDDGTTPTDVIGPTEPTDITIAGHVGKPACMGGMNGNLGADPITNPLCESTGGGGGKGQEGLGEAGIDGSPTPSPNPLGYGAGGLGAVAGGSSCKAGTNGATGDNGVPGAGATATQLGVIDLKGYLGVDGSAGERGRPGQGGGGGGGAKGKSGCYGASGGSGGAGGCGGFGGTSGKAGGASIALISLGATLMFDSVKLVAAKGGTGGGGGVGQQGAVGGAYGLGGMGASGASPTLAACTGGDGGVGGMGGRGGGGRGGHSIGIAWKGLAPPEELAESIAIGSPGSGGAGDDATNAGAEGQAAAVLEFP